MSVDVLLCGQCGTPQLEEDWTVPARPLRAGACINCGEAREDDICQGCGLARRDDLQVHQELRDLIDPNATLLNAAREASKQGRRVMALKLATAATQLDEDGKRNKSWALRVWLLSAIGEPKPALEDARYWVEGTPDPPAMAWASFAQQLEHQGYKGAAADAYGKAIELDPSGLTLRARRARLLITMAREGQALNEIGRLFRSDEISDSTMDIAVEVAEKLCYAFEKKKQETEIDFLLEKGARVIERSPVLLAYKARQAAIAGRVEDARRWLKAARALEPDLAIYERVQTQIRPARSSWWKW
ncbi:MAG: tetratricopeptide repeat protein [Myxococcota bacterium]